MNNICLNNELNLYLKKYKEKHKKSKIIFDEKFNKIYDLKIDYISKEIKNFNEIFLTNEIIKDLYLNNVFSFILKELKKNIDNKIIVIENITFFSHTKKLLIRYYQVDFCVELEFINNF